VRLTKDVGYGMLGLEVENVDGEANVIKEWVVLDNLCQRTVVIEEDVVWFDVATKGVFDHVCDTLNALGPIKGLTSNDHPAWSNDDLFVVGTFARELRPQFLGLRSKVRLWDLKFFFG